MVKGIIEKVENKYSYKVRIPVFHKIENTPGATPTDNLPTVPVCTLPGVNPIYQVGDIVWLGFENDEIGTPVIIGLLYREEQSNAISDMDCASITVQVDAKFPASTKIGDIGDKSLQALPQIIDAVNNLQSSI